MLHRRARGRNILRKNFQASQNREKLKPLHCSFIRAGILKETLAYEDVAGYVISTMSRDLLVYDKNLQSEGHPFVRGCEAFVIRQSVCIRRDNVGILIYCETGQSSFCICDSRYYCAL